MLKTKRKITYLRQPNNPAIILEGKHLIGLGFEVGGYFNVQYLPGQIQITKTSEEGGDKHD
jgi:hypothetical protein